MGVGLVIKSGEPKRFSLVMFGLSQVVIDLQPLVAMTTGGSIELHGISHTIVGATVIALLCLPFRRLLEIAFKQSIAGRAAIAGSFVGVYSHLILDSIVHADVSGNLFYPLHIDSRLLGLLSWEGMNYLCILLGALGCAVLWRRGEVLNALDNFSRKPSTRGFDS